MSGDTLQIFSEFLGTLILVLLGDGVCAAVNLKKSKAEASGWIVIALGWGAAVTIAVYVAGFMGPAHLNPAVTIAMAIAGNFSWSLVVPFILAQVAGGVIGATLVWLTYLDHWQATEDKGAILGTFATGPAIRNYPANVLTEMIGTIVLVLGLLSFSQHTFADGMNPLVVGVLIVSIGLSLGGATGYAINPARDLGPRIAHQILPIANKGDSDWSYSWVPVVGPVLGAIMAAGIFLVIM
ncbi:MIP/aquaporin family protein [Carnobacterium maltaromaticum]|jgi:glycerol uptake facilitator protein|uniref:MIP/aquaporin family protein n=1 Tax=Carnobacterium maltaromaticum TaxID=2751 RepID=UPI000E73F04B|nr:MIP/aquaporin family protein [Carnobacterium maltaromaticum]AOA03533.1 aquaporin [Carnobacterium maltaromaticum]MBC9789412.1 MIP family channel protein [Carnobacterium maltaromaticum]MCI1818039.1 aquaporin family protein [Carnobacterium maltaromaticum]